MNLDFSSSSNIIFSNGELDPWHAGGVVEDVMENNVVLMIPKSAHHLDLRTPNAADPPSVTQARDIETMHIKQWIEDYQNQIIPTIWIQ